MEKITLNSTVQRNDSRVAATELDDELVMMDLENGNYIKLNKTGRIIWDQTETPIQVSALIHFLTNKYQTDQKQCTQEVIEYLGKMENNKLLTIHL